MNVPIAVLSLSEDKKKQLKNIGLNFVHSIFDKGSKNDVKTILNVEELKELKHKPFVQSALEIWKTETEQRHIVTFSSDLDTLLGGGVEIRTITDFCGAPGTGKTQLCHQLCIDVQLPEDVGGVNGQALFIDTNFSFSRKRLHDMAESCVHHCMWMKESLPSSSAPMPSVQSLLSGVHVARAGTLEEFAAIIATLRDTLESMPQVKLIVIDSFSKPFLLFCEDLKKRTSLICDILATLQNLAWEFNIAVVTTSQLTTVIHPEGDASIIPGLGQGFAHRVTHRVLLGIVYRTENNRRAAQMFKSPSQPRNSTFFKIITPGVRDEGVSVPS